VELTAVVPSVAAGMAVRERSNGRLNERSTSGRRCQMEKKRRGGSYMGRLNERSTSGRRCQMEKKRRGGSSKASPRVEIGAALRALHGWEKGPKGLDSLNRGGRRGGGCRRRALIGCSHGTPLH
jgi:hypothetical protein